MNAFVISIDPGSSGAIAIQDAGLTRILAIHKIPMQAMIKGGSKGSKEVCLPALRAILEPYATPGTVAALEVAIGMGPRSSKAGIRTMGVNYGRLIASLSFLGVPYHEMMPAEWKKALGLSSDKGQSLAMVAQLYPAQTELIGKDDDKAEAVLIAHAARRAGYLHTQT